MVTTQSVGRATTLAGEASILASAVGYGLSTTLSVAALDVVRPPDLVAVELTGAAVALMVVAALKGRLRGPGTLRNLALGALMPGLAFVLGDLGLARTSASTGSLLIAVDPLLTVLLAVLFLGEALRGWTTFALVIGFAGSAVVALGSAPGGGGSEATVGNLLVIADVVVAAVFVIVVRRFSAGGSGLHASAWQTTGGAVCTSPFVLVGWTHGGSHLTGAGLGGWSLCAGVLVSTALAGVAFNWGIGRVPAVRAAQLGNLTPVAGMVAAVVLLAERPGLTQLAGGALVLLAVVLVVRTADGTDEPPGLEPEEASPASGCPT